MIDANLKFVPTRKMPANESGRPWPRPSGPWRMRMTWHDLLFAHYPIPLEQLRPLVPESLQIDTFDGSAWIGIVPFWMSGVAPRWMPGLPGVSRFPELNVRTYVSAGNRPGVWFFTLDADNRMAVEVARRTYHLNYLKARMDLSRRGPWLHYTSRRVDRRFAPAEYECEYRPIGRGFKTQPGTFAHWSTARYCLYTTNSQGQLFRGDIDHPPWVLHSAQLVTHKNSLLESLGLETLRSRPVLYYAHQMPVVAWGLERL